MVEWATKEVKIDSKHAAKLRDQEIRGSALLTMTEEKLRSIGIPLGPASDIVAAINSVLATPERASLFSGSFY